MDTTPTTTVAPPPGAPDRALVEALAVANRILYNEGVVDGFGHVSVRHDRSPAHFLLARNLAPALVTPDDILTFDLDGQALDAGDRRVYLDVAFFEDLQAFQAAGEALGVLQQRVAHPVDAFEQSHLDPIDARDRDKS